MHSPARPGIAIMVESWDDDLLGGVLYKEPADVLEALAKDYCPNMSTQTRGATLIGVRESPTKREATLAMRMLGLYFHPDKGLYDRWAKAPHGGSGFVCCSSRPNCCWSQLWEKIPMSAGQYRSLKRAATRRHSWTNWLGKYGQTHRGPMTPWCSTG